MTTDFTCILTHDMYEHNSNYNTIINFTLCGASYYLYGLCKWTINLSLR